MKRLKYTITSYQGLPKLEDFEAKDESDLLDKIKKYIEEDPSFVLDWIGWTVFYPNRNCGGVHKCGN